jgi:hypothetical protein
MSWAVQVVLDRAKSVLLYRMIIIGVQACDQIWVFHCGKKVSVVAERRWGDGRVQYETALAIKSKLADDRSADRRFASLKRTHSLRSDWMVKTCGCATVMSWSQMTKPCCLRLKQRIEVDRPTPSTPIQGPFCDNTTGRWIRSLLRAIEILTGTRNSTPARKLLLHWSRCKIHKTRKD